MAYYLNKEGLICFWNKIKEFLKEKYVAINDDITISKEIDGNNSTMEITNAGIATVYNGYAATVQSNIIALVTGILPTVSITEANIKLANNDYIDNGTNITPGSIETHKFIKTDGTSNQLLIADGSVVELNKPNGIPRLDNDGKLDTTQVDFISDEEINSIMK